jgi:Zn finger protein HypA/HybF involved in hydrogenase expression
MPDFEEITHTGGKLTFLYEEGGVSIRLQHASPFPATVFQVCISLDGKIVDFVAIAGEGGKSFYPQPSVLAPLLSDREGMFGRKCKACESYFRTSVLNRITICPYCGVRNRGVAFLTDNQLLFLTKVFNTYGEVTEKASTREIDLDAMIETLPNNTQAWVLKEERQQSLTKCRSCHCRYDVLGKYALCPACAKPNYESSFQRALEIIKADLTAAGTDPRNLPGEVFSKIFTEYEALGNAVRRQLLRLPMTERRRRETAKINFQRLAEAANLMEQYFAIRVNEGLSSDDISFLNIMVNRRHILIHESGRVDERYLQQTQDYSVRLNETVKITLEDAVRAMTLVQRCGMNLLKDWTSIR